MRSEVSVTFKDQPAVQIDLHDAQPMPSESARRWLDEQFTGMGTLCSSCRRSRRCLP